LSKIKIINVSDKNADDALLVCTSPRLQDDVNVKIGLEIRKKWLSDLYREVGSCAKIAYLNGKPVGMIQYSPLHVIPYFKTKRRDVQYIHCIYVRRDIRNRGVGSALLNALINDMKKTNKQFGSSQCTMLCTTARKRHGFTQVGFFKSKNFLKTEGNIDAGLIYPLCKTSLGLRLDIPKTRPARIQEKGAKIFFNPSCHMSKYMNENIKAKIREVNPAIEIEECNLWNSSQEACRRRITSVVTYINGKPILPMEPQKFWERIKQLSIKTSCA